MLLLTNQVYIWGSCRFVRVCPNCRVEENRAAAAKKELFILCMPKSSNSIFVVGGIRFCVVVQLDLVKSN
jgi:hypothetical protein